MKHSAASLVALILVVAGAAAIRIACLDNRPMHTDEAVHAFKFGPMLEKGILEEGSYVYDPIEYHGPTLNYMTVPVVLLDGGNSLAQTTETHLRLVPAICGILLIAGLWLIRDGIGRSAMLCAAVLCAASPAMIYYSRYYIQEMLLVCFTFFAITTFWRCAADRNIVLRVFWLVVAGLSLGLMHATKETCAIAIFAMVVAGALALLLSLLRAGKPQELGDDQPEQPSASFGGKVKFGLFGGIVVLIVAAAVSVTLFSSFFTNPDGPWDSIATYGNYLTQAGGEGSAGSHRYPWYHYLRIVGWWKLEDGAVWTEGFVLLLAAIGLIAGVIGRGCGKANITFVRFLCVYTVVMTGVYSMLSYKTPWCLLGFFHGMILLAGVGAVALLRIAHFKALRAIVAVVLLTGTGHLAWQGYNASFPQCADKGNPYVYSHTTQDVPKLVEEVRSIAEMHPDGKNMHLQVICADNDPWPFPWYFRDFPLLDMRVSDEKGRILPWPLAPVFIYRPDLDERINNTLTVKMLMSSPYDWLRPPIAEGQKPRDWEMRALIPLHVRVDRKLLKKYNDSRSVKPK